MICQNRRPGRRTTLAKALDDNPRTGRVSLELYGVGYSLDNTCSFERRIASFGILSGIDGLALGRPRSATPKRDAPEDYVAKLNHSPLAAA